MPRVWVPLDAAGAAAFFQRTFISKDRRHKGWAWIKVMIKQVLIRLPGQSPIAILAQRAEFSKESADLPILAWVREHWAGWRLGSVPRMLSCLLVTEGYRDINKCALLVFSEPSANPVLAVKIPRIKAAARSILREAAALEFLDGMGGISGVPRPIWCGPLGPLPALVQTALPGRALIGTIDSSNCRSVALQVTDWLAMLARRTARPDDNGRWVRLVEPTIACFERNFGLLPGVGARNRLSLTPEAAAGLPLVVEHRDLSPWNVLARADGTIAVLDWESSEVAGFPGLDLLYFLAYLAFQAEKIPYRTASAELRACYRRTLNPATPMGALRAECLARYAVKIGVSPGRLEMLAPLAWMIHSQSEHRNFAADAGREPTRERLRDSVFLALLEEESR